MVESLFVISFWLINETPSRELWLACVLAKTDPAKRNAFEMSLGSVVHLSSLVAIAAIGSGKAGSPVREA